MAAMSIPQASVVFDVLVELCGAREAKREDFMRYLTSDTHMGHEFRFMGSLGSGGKLYWDGRNPPYVGCYGEDRDAEAERAISKANAHLKLLFSEQIP